VASSLDELLAGSTERIQFRSEDGKSQAPMERVVIGGESFVVKHLHVDDDWLARGYGDLGCHPLTAWRSGLLDSLPPCIDHAVVGAAGGLGRNGWGAALLMRDVSAWLVAEGDPPVPLDQHRRFLHNMAALHARFAGFSDTIGLTPPAHRWLAFGLDMIAAEVERGEAAVPRIAAEGWARFPERAAGDVAAVVDHLRHDPAPLTRALETTPATLVHGDWKLGNLGTAPGEVTILLDWQSPGQGPGAADLGWYLALNAARLPETKEEAIAAYHGSLVSQGVDTAGWWERQLGLCLLGTVVLFGWEKALGDPVELGWWCDRAREGICFL